jgi:hypothetical protein
VVNKSILMIVNCDFYIDRGNRSFALIPVLVPILGLQVIVYAVANGSLFPLHINGMLNIKAFEACIVAHITDCFKRATMPDPECRFVKSWDTII